MPEKLGYRTLDSSPWRACPNSWNSVVTVSSDSNGWEPSVGLVMFSTFTTTGLVPSSSDWSTKVDIHAPPRFDGRA